MPAQNTMPLPASPNTAKPATPKASPAMSAVRSPKRSTVGPITAPCTTMEQMPTPAMVKPTVRSSQP
jgi:hypothetical protein